MSAHQLTIAKASFAAGLLRPDITKVGREELTIFHGLLETAVTTCSPRNVQTCKEWLSDNIAPSSARTGALGKYLASLSKHAHQDPGSESGRKSASGSRKRLHVMYILSDLLHHSKHHTSDLSSFSILTSSIQPFLIDLFQLAASEKRLKIKRRLEDLLDLWQEERYYSEDYIHKLRQAVADFEIALSGEGVGNIQSVSGQQRPTEPLYVMPASHGDASTPFYDLPAGNLMPHIMPGSSAPIRPDQVRPLQFTAGPADKNLVNAVKDFFKDVEAINHIYDQPDDDTFVTEIDELGQVSYRDETGEVRGDTYYGWSRAFCEKMKRRRRGPDGASKGERGRSIGSSKSSSRSSRKRRRYSDASSRRSSSYSRSRSRVRFGRGESPRGQNGRLRSRTRSRSPLPKRESPPRPIAMQGSQPPVAFAPVSRPQPPPARFTIARNAPTFQPPGLGPNGLPIPPPRPPGWSGIWPPAPPPMGYGRRMVIPPPPGPFHNSSNFSSPPPPPGYPGPYGDGR